MLRQIYLLNAKLDRVLTEFARGDQLAKLARKLDAKMIEKPADRMVRRSLADGESLTGSAARKKLRSSSKAQIDENSFIYGAGGGEHEGMMQKAIMNERRGDLAEWANDARQRVEATRKWKRVRVG